jgi:hypothetical protein
LSAETGLRGSRAGLMPLCRSRSGDPVMQPGIHACSRAAMLCVLPRAGSPQCNNLVVAMQAATQRRWCFWGLGDQRAAGVSGGRVVPWGAWADLCQTPPAAPGLMHQRGHEPETTPRGSRIALMPLLSQSVPSSSHAATGGALVAACRYGGVPMCSHTAVMQP